jgi:hypothetical protein
MMTTLGNIDTIKLAFHRVLHVWKGSYSHRSLPVATTDNIRRGVDSRLVPNPQGQTIFLDFGTPLVVFEGCYTWLTAIQTTCSVDLGSPIVWTLH